MGCEMKIWNVGLTVLNDSRENIGFHVSAEHADAAEYLARLECAARDIPLYAGCTLQVRDDDPGYNAYFDGAFRYVGSIL